MTLLHRLPFAALSSPIGGSVPLAWNLMRPNRVDLTLELNAEAPLDAPVLEGWCHAHENVTRRRGALEVLLMQDAAPVIRVPVTFGTPDGVSVPAEMSRFAGPLLQDLDALRSGFLHGEDAVVILPSRGPLHALFRSGRTTDADGSIRIATVPRRVTHDIPIPTSAVIHAEELVFDSLHGFPRLAVILSEATGLGTTTRTKAVIMRDPADEALAAHFPNVGKTLRMDRAGY